MMKAVHKDGYPYPLNDGQTHSSGCWRTRHHHNCAVAQAEELQLELEKLKVEHALRGEALSVATEIIGRAPLKMGKEKPHPELVEPKVTTKLGSILKRCIYCGSFWVHSKNCKEISESPSTPHAERDTFSKPEKNN